MRGEHCIAGASILTAMAMIMLTFANIGQVNSGAVCNGLYMAELNVAAYGNAVLTTNKKADGLYDTTNDAKKQPMGSSKGLRQYYRYGLYGACGYQKDGKGICNSTAIGYGFAPFAQMLSDAPSSPANYKTITTQIIPDDMGGSFKNDNWNRGLSAAGSVLIFVASLLALAAFILGFIKARLTFLGAAICSGISAFFLMVGSAIWTSVIAKDAALKVVKVQGGKVSLGINVNAGPSLYLSWVAFVFMTLSVAPYVISACTFRRK